MVEIRNGRISVSAKEVPLEVLCKDIETRSGVRFNIESALVGKKLSTEFKNLSLLKGIKRLLARMNYMICFDELNKLSEVFIVRRSEPNPLPVMRRYTPPRGGAGIRRPLNRGLP
jgi:type II secretory pathway component GspD/PulD (secretin)